MGNKNKRIKLASDKGYVINEFGQVVSPNGNILKISLTSTNYYSFSFSLGYIPLHRFIAYKKFGDKMFEKGIVVRHLDGDRLNNSFENISIGTQSQNMMDRDSEVRLNHSIHASSFIKKYNHEEIYELHLSGYSYKEIMEECGISSKGTIAWIIKKMKRVFSLIG